MDVSRKSPKTRFWLRWAACFAACLFLSTTLTAQEPAANATAVDGDALEQTKAAEQLVETPDATGTIPPVTGLKAFDMPYDDGSAIALTWDKHPAESTKGFEFIVERARRPEGPFEEVARIKGTESWMTDAALPFWAWSRDPNRHFASISTPTLTQDEADARSMPDAPVAAEKQRGVPYHFRVRAINAAGKSDWSDSVTASAVGNWFALEKLNSLLVMVIFGGILLVFLEFAKRQELFLRKIPGLAAVNEALGRATEMGRPVVFMTGRQDVNHPSTIAASIVLGEVAKKTAQYDVKLDVPHTYSVTMEICREITKEAYLEAGRPDAYSDDINYYVTEDQFSYAAAVNGKMLREKPGAVFYAGYYYAESLLMAEAAATTGAIQIAATDAEHQLPFFVTACDYTLIGEELYAASAYLSRSPALVGALRGQDMAKLCVMISVLAGSLLATGLTVSGQAETLNWLKDLWNVFG